MSFFPPPPIKEMSVFTRLPDPYRRREESVWACANRPKQRVDSFLEGPAFDGMGRLYVTDIPFGRIFRVERDGEWELIAEYDGWPNGLKISRDGAIVIADFKRGLMRLDADSGTVKPLIETVHSESFKGVNDLVFGSDGEIYFTDQGQTGMHDPTGRVYRLSRDGRLTRLLETAPSPNGIALDPAGESLFVAMTRANQVWRIPLHDSGIVAKVGVFANLHGGTAGPDGIAFDEDGNLFVAHAGMGCVWVLSPSAVPILCLRSHEGTMTTNLAFGGADGKTLFVTESETGTILTASMERAGLNLYSDGTSVGHGGA